MDIPASCCWLQIVLDILLKLFAERLATRIDSRSLNRGHRVIGVSSGASWLIYCMLPFSVLREDTGTSIWFISKNSCVISQSSMAFSRISFAVDAEPLRRPMPQRCCFSAVSTLSNRITRVVCTDYHFTSFGTRWMASHRRLLGDNTNTSLVPLWQGLPHQHKSPQVSLQISIPLARSLLW